MATRVAYLAVDKKVLVASGQDTLQYTPGPNEKFYIEQWRFVSTGIFDIIDVRNSEQFKYTQCSVTKPIPSTVVQNPTNAFLGLKDFDPPLMIDSSQTFSIDVKDTSGAGNTVTVVLAGYKDIG